MKLKISSVNDLLASILGGPINGSADDSSSHSTGTSKKALSVNASRKKVRSPHQMVNYATGNSLIDWLIKHPNQINIKMRPLPFKTTFKTAKDEFLTHIETVARKFKLKFKRIKSIGGGSSISGSGGSSSETILAMKECYDVIINCTLVDRTLGHMSHADALVKSTVLTKFTEATIHATDASAMTHYVPICFGASPEADLNIAISLKVLAKYQGYLPTCGYKIIRGEIVPYKPTTANYELITEAVKWLDEMDTLDADTEIGANGHITDESPWCLAVKTRAMEQEHISMLPQITCTATLDWRTIDEYKGRLQSDWVANYYSSTGENMQLFRELYDNTGGFKFVHVSKLDGIPYQVTIIDTDKGQYTYWLADKLTDTSNMPQIMGLKYLTWDSMKEMLSANQIKFPYTASYDLDFICMRVLTEEEQQQVPVINFSVEEVAREHYYGTSDKLVTAKLLKQASDRIPMILQFLIKK
jgi:hypothetical protein